MKRYTGTPRKAPLPAASLGEDLGVVLVPAAPVLALALRNPPLAYALYATTSREHWTSKAARRARERAAWSYICGLADSKDAAA